MLKEFKNCFFLSHNFSFPAKIWRTMDVTELLNFKPKTVPKRPAPEDIPDDIDDTDDPSNSLTNIFGS